MIYIKLNSTLIDEVIEAESAPSVDYVEITETQKDEMSNHRYGFGAFEYIGGVLQEGALAAELDTAKRLELITQSVQDHLNAQAKSKGYDDINSIAKYIGYPNTYQAECEALAAWAASVWDSCYAMLGQYQAGTITEPTTEDVINQLPGAPI